MNEIHGLNRRAFLKKCGIAAGLASSASLLSQGNKTFSAPLAFFNLGVITDEVSNDLEKGLRFAKDFGLHWVELRNVWGKYVTDIDDTMVKDAKKLLKQYGLRVSVVDTAFLKCTLPGTTLPKGEKDSAPFDQQFDMLKRACEKAKMFNAPYLRIFTFWRVEKPESIMNEIVANLEKALSIAAPQGITLLVENEYACNIGTGAESAAMLARISNPYLAIAWDPGNAVMLGEKPYPDGYNKIEKSRIKHMHLKDASPSGHGFMKMGAGSIDYMGQFRALLDDGFRGTISLETHYKVNGSGEVSSRESMQGIIEMIQKL